ncbi:NADPH-dependent FMN reductase [Afifella sp. IM 167]|uniref:NADPH-dependent FMN reductase n=1 Tax=Afifella sp. IM 167 TaxID=2033586 RepID=UPI001CC9D646|nr:NADPH-dependent FMN reductase [Afifella sp. IM 167]MBZ8133732.1 NADPH-dependent FMN reductase [Afifella sp. IM 167]
MAEKTATPIKVLALSGSLRRASYNTALLRAAAELAPAGMTIEIYDLADIPMYNDDVRLAGFPPETERFRDALRQADAVLIASPEYNRSVPGVLKNAIDWASRKPDQPFAGKPIAIMGVSNGALGAAFANHHLRQIFVFMDAVMVNGPEVMVGGAKERFDEQGRLTHQATRDFVGAHLERLARLTRQTKAAQAE